MARKWLLALCLSSSFGAAYGQRASSPVSRTLQRREWFYQQRAYPRDFVPPHARPKALEQFDRMIADRAAQAAQGLAPVPAAWRLTGPQPTIQGSIRTSGMTTSIAIDPRNTSVVYLGAPDGGVWKTSDAGVHWTPLTDSQPSMSIGSIALDPTQPDTVYVGTGSYLGTGSGGFGAGILKSSDGGNTWQNYPAPFVGPTGTDTYCGAGDEIGALAVNPNSPQIVLAGVFHCYNSAGIYRSTDGGATWTQVFAGSEATAIFFDSVTPNVAYASIGRFFTDPQNGVLKSIDGGQTWTSLYEMDYTAEIEFLGDCMWGSGGAFGGDRSFEAFSGWPGGGLDAFNPRYFLKQKARKGERRKIEGKFMFQKTEQEWRLVG